MVAGLGAGSTPARAKCSGARHCTSTPCTQLSLLSWALFVLASCRMLLTISTTHQPATDLGYLLHKNPARLQSVDIAYGLAHVFYPEATAERCTVALLLDIDPIGLVRNHRGPAGEGFALEQYVNDRPYAASSFLSTALVKAFNTALNGTCKDRPELPDTLLPLEATVAALPAANAEQLRRLFLPLGYEVET